jgi:hypothetical protein
MGRIVHPRIHAELVEELQEVVDAVDDQRRQQGCSHFCYLGLTPR